MTPRECGLLAQLTLRWARIQHGQLPAGMCAVAGARSQLSAVSSDRELMTLKSNGVALVLTHDTLLRR